MDDGKAEVRVIEVNDGRTQTGERRVQMQVKGGKLQWQDSGCMLAAVLERHGKNGNIGFGFVTGDCIKRGAAATTYFHDHHNLMVIGANPVYARGRSQDSEAKRRDLHGAEWAGKSRASAAGLRDLIRTFGGRNWCETEPGQKKP